MIIYRRIDEEGEIPPDTIEAWLPRGACVVSTDDNFRVLWMFKAQSRTIEGPIEKLEAGLELADLTAPQLQALAVHLGAKTRAKKKASLVKALSRHLEGLGA